MGYVRLILKGTREEWRLKEGKKQGLDGRRYGRKMRKRKGG